LINLDQWPSWAGKVQPSLYGLSWTNPKKKKQKKAGAGLGWPSGPLSMISFIL
jgi:hypothetical protein